MSDSNNQSNFGNSQQPDPLAATNAEQAVPNVPTMPAMPSIPSMSGQPEPATAEPAVAQSPATPAQAAETQAAQPSPYGESVQQPYGQPVNQPYGQPYGQPQFGAPQQPYGSQPSYGAPQYGIPQYGAPANGNAQQPPEFGAYGQPLNQGIPPMPGAGQEGPMPPYATQPGSGDTSIEPPLWHPWYGISFPSAIARFFKKYATFNGRASRSEYWWVMLFLALVQVVFIILESATNNSNTVTIINGVWSLAIFIPQLAILVRRLHDTNRSGWWVLVPYLLSIVGTIMIAAGGVTSFVGIASDSSALPTGLGVMGIGALLTIIGGVLMFVFTLLPSKPEGARFDKPTM